MHIGSVIVLVLTHSLFPPHSNIIVSLVQIYIRHLRFVVTVDVWQDVFLILDDGTGCCTKWLIVA